MLLSYCIKASQSINPCLLHIKKEAVQTIKVPLSPSSILRSINIALRFHHLYWSIFCASRTLFCAVNRTPMLPPLVARDYSRSNIWRDHWRQSSNDDTVFVDSDACTWLWPVSYDIKECAVATWTPFLNFFFNSNTNRHQYYKHRGFNFWI